MIKFNLDDERKFQNFSEDILKKAEAIKEVASGDDYNLLVKIKDNFELKINDFYNENRKLNIGVVGQVKAGKSSFLNTLLFDGQEILPKASTPKTATLTKMEYSEKNIIEIEYYSVDEWEGLEDNANVDSDDEIYLSAREIVNLARKNGINPQEHLSKGYEQIEFDEYEDLMSELNQFVGEDGKFTPLVKAVTLKLNKEEFRGLSIVDTPGLNDPIVSRTIRTKEFMEVCDVVFFLSQSGSFLDSSDWKLLSEQLPQKGVKKLTLIGSKYDSGVRDVLRPTVEDDIFGDSDDGKTDNIPQACKMINAKLSKRAREKIAEFQQDARNRQFQDDIIEAIGMCSAPVLVSAMAYNMTNKDESLYNNEELNLFNALKPYTNDIQSDLKLLGNIDVIKESFEELITEKEDILQKKSVGFIPTAEAEVNALLNGFKEKNVTKLAILEGTDKTCLVNKKKEVESNMNSVKNDIISAFGEVFLKLENEKIDALQTLRKLSSENSSIKERKGVETVYDSYSVSTSKWYNPFSWGTSRTEHYSYEKSYTYLSASDVLDNLRNFVVGSTNTIESVFTEALNMKEVKRKLLTVVTNNFDMSDESFDSGLFKLIVEETINQVEFPVIKVDSTATLNEISSKFSGEVTNSSDKQALRTALEQGITRFFDLTATSLEENIKDFKVKVDVINKELSAKMLENIQSEFDELIEKFEDKEKEIGTLKEYIKILEKF